MSLGISIELLRRLHSYHLLGRSPRIQFYCKFQHFDGLIESYRIDRCSSMGQNIN